MCWRSSCCWSLIFASLSVSCFCSDRIGRWREVDMLCSYQPHESLPAPPRLARHKNAIKIRKQQFISNITTVEEADKETITSSISVHDPIMLTFITPPTLTGSHLSGFQPGCPDLSLKGTPADTTQGLKTFLYMFFMFARMNMNQS